MSCVFFLIAPCIQSVFKEKAKEKFMFRLAMRFTKSSISWMNLLTTNEVFVCSLRRILTIAPYIVSFVSFIILLHCLQ
jgi:hypothetical protein